jgi:hypothetical protein
MGMAKRCSNRWQDETEWEEQIMSYSAVMLDSHTAGAKTFNQARSHAGREALWSRLVGRTAKLRCFKDEVAGATDAKDYQVAHGQVPLQSIVGSVERCSDYTRGFMPLKDSDRARWTRVEKAFREGKPLPPIQVREVGEDYYVIDGHHRVSVARKLGFSHLEARVLQPKARAHGEVTPTSTRTSA